MKNLKKLFIMSKSTILETLKVINDNAKGIAFVIDDGNRLLGTITDGDIRRAIIRGVSLNNEITNIYNKNCVFIKEDYRHKASNIFEKRIAKVIPVIDNERIVVDYIELSDLLTHEELKKHNPVLIMAGGLGTRLRPLTNDIPKPMLKVGGKPMLEIIINQFKNMGFTNILLSVNYKSEIIENYFRDGEDFGVNIKYIKEVTRMGTAGAIRLAEKYLNEPFFVINGDILTNVNFQSLLNYHSDNKFSMTIGSRMYEMQVPYGVLNMDELCVSSLEEKPVLTFNVNGGIYVLDPKVINYIPENEYFDITELINILVIESEKIGSFPIREYWMDIGRLEDYDKANEDAKILF